MEGKQKGLGMDGYGGGGGVAGKFVASVTVGRAIHGGKKKTWEGRVLVWTC